MLTLFIIILVLLIGFSAILSGSETAFFSLSPFTITSYKKSDSLRKKTIAHLLKSPRDLLVTIMMLNILANILVQNTVSNLFGSTSSWLVSVGVPLVLTLLFGEILPKSIAITSNKAVANRMTPFITFVFKVVGPVRRGLTAVTGYLSRTFFFFIKKEREVSAEELHFVVEHSKEKGILHLEEYELIQGYLELRQANVKELLRPRDEVIYYDLDSPLEELIEKFVDQQCTRVLVCEKDLQNLKGVISIKQFIFHKESISSKESLIKELKKPFYVPETKNAWHLFQILRERDEDIAIVVDEYGSIAGIITQEDLIESVLGEITDRRDTKALYTFSGDHVIIASGKLEIDELEALFDAKLDKKNNVVTIGGFLVEELGEIPQAGTKYATDDFLFYVLSSDPNRVRRVYIRHLKPKKKR